MGANESAKKLTKAQEGILYLVRAEGRRIYNGRARRPVEALEKAGLVNVDWDMDLHVKGNGMDASQRITVTALCGTAGCKRPVAEEISYKYRGGEERDTELVCTPCADGYERRVVLTSFTRRPLFEGTLQIQRRSWTASVNPPIGWEDLRPAKRHELTLLRSIPDGGSAFWLRPDGTSYYALGARSNADQLARIVRL
jgi:hypothetical protein